MRAFGGFHAFPGGTLDPSDHTDEAAEVSTLTPAQAEAALGEDAGGLPALGFYVCALRELFEEVGILLATDGDAPAEVPPSDLEKAREAVAGGAAFPQVVASMGLKMATHLLGYRSRWVAPRALPVRFDVRVFVAPALGEPDPDPAEVEAVEWLSAEQVLARMESGSVIMAPPTLATVDMLSRYTSAGALLGGSGSDPAAAEPERCSPMVRRLVAPNPSIMTGPGTNTYVVGSEELLVIDVGSMDPGHLGALAGLGTISTVVVTHHHPDHVSGSLELAERTGAEVVASTKFWEMARNWSGGRGVSDGDQLSVEGLSLEVVETPGHASDHICLWFNAEKALFAGDLVLGEGTTVISPPDGNLTDYLASLEKVAALEPEVLYPGHFPPRDDAAEWIGYYLSHRLQREDQVLAALFSGASRIPDIVAVVYTSYPEELHPVAERSVAAHLEKLQQEGRVVSRGDDYLISG